MAAPAGKAAGTASRLGLRQAVVPLLKALHIVALALWCAGLLCLPALLVQHTTVDTQRSFAELRRFVRIVYVRIMTPAAVIAVAAGTALIFARGVFVGWMILKLAIVGVLVALHAYEGRVLHALADGEAHYQPWKGYILTGGSLALMTAIISIVLAKPVLDESRFPAWLLEPRGRQLSDAVPI